MSDYLNNSIYKFVQNMNSFRNETPLLLTDAQQFILLWFCFRTIYICKHLYLLACQ